MILEKRYMAAGSKVPEYAHTREISNKPKPVHARWLFILSDQR